MAGTHSSKEGDGEALIIFPFAWFSNGFTYLLVIPSAGFYFSYLLTYVHINLIMYITERIAEVCTFAHVFLSAYRFSPFFFCFFLGGGNQYKLPRYPTANQLPT